MLRVNAQSCLAAPGTAAFGDMNLGKGTDAAAGFDPDISILDDIDAADPVSTCKGVGSSEKLDRFGNGYRHPILCVLEFYGDAFRKFYHKMLWLIARFLGIYNKLPHVCRRRRVWVLK